MHFFNAYQAKITLRNSGAIDVNQRFLVSESNFCWYYLRNILSYGSWKEDVTRNKKSCIKMFKTALLDCAINEKCCSVDGGRGICPLFSSPPQEIWQLKSPHPREFPIQGQKHVNAVNAGRSWNWLMHNKDYPVFFKYGHDVFWHYSYSSVISVLLFVYYLNDGKAQHSTSLMQVFVEGFW